MSLSARRSTTRREYQCTLAPTPSSRIRDQLTALRESPVTLLVLLAGSAGAGGVPRHLAPGVRSVGIPRQRGGPGGPRRFRRTRCGCRSGIRPGLAPGFLLDRRRLWRGCRLDLQVAEGPRHRLAKPCQHRVEQLERFGLVFVQRVFLGIGAEPDALAKVIEAEQMLLPDLVEQLQEDALLREP